MRRRHVMALVVLMAGTTGCTALRREWSDKQGAADNDDAVRTAVERALPDAEEVAVSSSKNGFQQETDVLVALPDASFDADDLLATAQAICGAAELTDAVFVEVTDASTRTAIDLTALAEQVPGLDTPYEQTRVQIEVEDDCADL